MIRVRSLSDLVVFAENHYAIVTPHGCFRRPCPAAWVLNMTGGVIHRLIQSGMFVYEPKPKEEKKWPQKKRNPQQKTSSR